MMGPQCAVGEVCPQSDGFGPQLHGDNVGRPQEQRDGDKMAYGVPRHLNPHEAHEHDARQWVSRGLGLGDCDEKTREGTPKQSVARAGFGRACFWAELKSGQRGA